jgi:hypothetical protein
MNKSILLAVIVGSWAFAATAPALAGTPRLDHRETHQANRIYNGVANGELTRPEARRLSAGQDHLYRAEARPNSDAQETSPERAHLQHEANQQSRRIYRQKHDAQDRK